MIRKELKRMVMPALLGFAIGTAIGDWFMGFLIGFVFWIGTSDTKKDCCK